MRIGLVRHFKVAHQPVSGRISGEQFNAWVEAYNQSNIESGVFSNSELNWEMCFSSDLPRAIHTATQIYTGDIIYTKQLREIEIVANSQTGIKLHHSIWLALGRIGWYMGHSSQPERRGSTLLRTQAVIERLERDFGSSNVLLVTHGAFMKVLAQQLAQRGYIGKRIFYPRNGELYLYEKNS
jgi:broad specificity phosphatase PhoE